MKVLFVPILCLAAVLLFHCTTGESPEPTAETEPTREERIAHGAYLVQITGCDHCHTPKKMTDQGPVPDMDRWMMGYPASDPLPEVVGEAVGPGKWVLFHGDLTAAVGPWGISYSANLTPHVTGIGDWTFDQFKKSVTQGKHKGLDGGRMVMPPMPWQGYTKMKDEDLRSIYVYLMSIEPRENLVPAYTPPNAI